MYPLHLSAITPLLQHQAASWCNDNLPNHNLQPAESMVDALSILTDKPVCQLRQEVRDLYLVTEGLTWPVMQWWLENMVTTGADLMEHYLDMSSTVDGLFVWLTSVLM